MEKLAVDFLGQQTGPLALVIGVIAALIWLIVKTKKAVSTVWPFIRKLVAVVEDLFGTEGRPGVEARPGIMARMASGEATDRAITATLAEHTEALLELRPNHGGSMKDVLNATRKELASLKTQLNDHISEQRTAVVNAETSAIDAVAAVRGAQEAVVGAKEAVVEAKDAVTAAIKDRHDIQVTVLAGK